MDIICGVCKLVITFPKYSVAVGKLKKLQSPLFHTLSLITSEMFLTLFSSKDVHFMLCLGKTQSSASVLKPDVCSAAKHVDTVLSHA